MATKIRQLSHLQLAHHFWRTHLRPDDWAIDATCGAGYDTKMLAEALPEGGVIALDIQEEAIARTRDTLGDELLSRVHLFRQSHASFPSLASLHPIRLIVYNLGYLPQGDKAITTKTRSTLASLDAATRLLAPDGILSITCYPGHPEGAKEEQQILPWAASLSPNDWRVFRYFSPNQPLTPNLFIIHKFK